MSLLVIRASRVHALATLGTGFVSSPCILLGAVHEFNEQSWQLAATTRYCRLPDCLLPHHVRVEKQAILPLATPATRFRPHLERDYSWPEFPGDLHLRYVFPFRHANHLRDSNCQPSRLTLSEIDPFFVTAFASTTRNAPSPVRLGPREAIDSNRIAVNLRVRTNGTIVEHHQSQVSAARCISCSRFTHNTVMPNMARNNMARNNMARHTTNLHEGRGHGERGWFILPQIPRG